MIMKKRNKNYPKINNNFLIFLTFLFLSSCETISYIPNKIVETGSDTVDYVASLFKDSDKVKMQEGQGEDGEELSSDDRNSITQTEPPKNDQQKLNEVDDKQLLETSEETLEPAPTEKLVKKDVDQFNEQENLKKRLDTNKKLVDNKSFTQEEFSDLKTAEPNYNQTTIEEFNAKTRLSIKNKIQFRIATINFKSGSSIVNNLGLKKIKKVLKLAKEKKAIVRIVGHASTRTKDMDILKHKLVNFQISDKRAQSVASIFIKNKFPLNKLITEAVSDSKPLFHELMPAGTQANQRTEIYLIY